MANPHEFALILAGGGGTRLWPKSREKTPKQFLKLASNKTLLRLTAERIKELVEWDHMYVITNVTQYDDVVREVPEIPKEQIICEPMKRETAMAMAVGALVIHARDPECVVMNFASDHIVPNQKEFVHVMRAVATIAKDASHLVSIGIMPTYAHTGLGYIQTGSEVSKQDGLPVLKVESFKEKPDVKTAEAFLATGKYFWNANMYTWSGSAILDAFKNLAPKTSAVLDELRPSIGTATFVDALKKAYESVESISIDYAISEKSTNLLLVPGDFGWNDIGDWSVVHSISQQDADGNVILKEANSEVITYNTKNTMVEANGRLIALVDLENVIVVDTKDILLVMDKSHSQDVKKIVEMLKEQKKQQYL